MVAGSPPDADATSPGGARSRSGTERGAELVGLDVDMIVTNGGAAVLAARRATRTIPIVVAASGDLVALGLAASLASEQATQFDLFVNMRTAGALGVRILDSIRVQATKVIE